MQSLRPFAGAVLSSTWPPGSRVRRPAPGNTPGFLSESSTLLILLNDTALDGSVQSLTSHSSSAPIVPGGPVLKQIAPISCSASASEIGAPAPAPGPAASG